MSNGYYTCAEVARMFHISIPTVGYYIEKGRLPQPIRPSGAARGKRLWPKNVIDKIHAERFGEPAVATGSHEEV